MCTERLHARSGCRQRGISLIETILFIVIVGVGVAGLAGVMSSTLKYSADPMIRKQAVAVAESLLEEIMLQPFTRCDLDTYDGTDPTGPCTAEALGPETIGGVTESRTSLTNPFDNVNDYHGFTMTNGIGSITDNQVITGLERFSAAVTMTEVGITDFNLGNAAHALKITVRVTGPNSEDITLTGYRFRYDPNP